MSRDKEEWRPVVGWEGLYEVSSHGRVRSCKVLRPGLTNGYKRVVLCDDGRRVTRGVHILVAEAFCGDRSGPLVRHLDGTRDNNRATNLAFGTHLDNSADMIAHGRSLRGVDHFKAILSERDAYQIRALRGKLIAKEVASIFGVSTSAIVSIWHRYNWRYLPHKSDCAVLDFWGDC